MSQHDFSVANADGATVRADLNAGLQALASTSKGSSAPATLYTGQLWIDDSATPWKLMLYDGTTSWEVCELDATNNRMRLSNSGVDDNGSATRITIDASNNVLIGNGAAAVTFDSSGNLTAKLGIGFADQKIQAFEFDLNNNAGTLRHRIGVLGAAGTAATYVDKITGASNSYGNTPTGADASTAFVNGVKIGSADTNTIYFDTAAQTQANFAGIATILFNSTGTRLTAWIFSHSININGTTRRRLAISFWDAATGAAFALNTTNIAASKSIQVTFLAFLA